MKLGSLLFHHSENMLHTFSDKVGSRRKKWKLENGVGRGGGGEQGMETIRRP